MTRQRPLTVRFLKTAFRNPLIIPSGIIPEIQETKKAQKWGAGGVVTKSLTIEPREGNLLPRVITYEHGILNSVGLRGPGLQKGIKLLRNLLLEMTIPTIVSIFAVSVADFKTLALAVAKLGVQFLELNLSCPNTTDELGESLGMGVESTTAAVKGVRKAVGRSLKLIAKLSPNVRDIGSIAQAAEKAGADAISAVNTVGPGMVIDINRQRPILGNKEGGVSGPGIRPIAIRCVYDIYRAVQIPIIGMGGVERWQDVVEMMMAGATLVGVGSAIYRRGDLVYREIVDGLRGYTKEQNISDLSAVVGAAHDS